MLNNVSNGKIIGQLYNDKQPLRNTNQPSTYYNNNFMRENDVFTKVDTLLPTKNIIDPISNKTIGQTYITYVNIDSKNRVKFNMNEYNDEIVTLSNNSILFENGNDELTIYIPNHSFVIGDSIAIRNFSGYYVKEKKIACLNCKSNYILYKTKHYLSYEGLVSNKDHTIYSPIPNISHIIDTTNARNNQSNKTYYKLKNPPRKYFLEISGFTNNISNVLNSYLNGSHTAVLVYSLKDGIYKEETDFFLVELPVFSDISYVYNDIIKIEFLSVYGIPINLINSGTPTNDKQLLESHIITYVDIDVIRFSINISAIINETTKIPASFNYDIYKIENVRKGYPDPNKYVVTLEKIFNNVIQIKLLSTSFPNSIPIIDTYNNSLKWLFLEDTTINEIFVPIGTYSNLELKKILEKLSCTGNGCLNFDFNKSNNITTVTAKKELVILNIDNNIKLFSTLFTATFAFPLTNDFSSIVGFPVNKYNPTDDILYFYFTPNSHQRITEIFSKYNTGLYIAKYSSNNKIIFEYTGYTNVLVYFYRNKLLYPVTTHITENISLNSDTSLNEATLIEDKLYLINHNLKINDIIITDIFNNNNYVYLYKVIEIIDSNILRIEQNSNIKFIYDGLIINFAKDAKNNVYWLDQINNDTPVNNNTLSIIAISNIESNQTHIKLKLEEHNLEKGKILYVNELESTVTNIISPNEIELITNNVVNSVDIMHLELPIKFKLFFDYANSIGKILGFKNVGQSTSITDYAFTIENIMDYPKNYIPIQDLPTINTPEYPYFYICSEILKFYENTYPVQNVFAKIRWFNYNKKNDTTVNDIIIYDSFAASNNIYQKPIGALIEVDFEFLNPDGSLVNFFKQDHSFTLEITELSFQPVETDISSRTNTTLYTRNIN